MDNAQTEHTPGPWEVESDGSTVAMGGQCVITAPVPDGGTRAEEEANAQAISAVPDLLEACRKAERALLHSNSHVAFNAVRKAIAKATGKE